MLKYTEVTDRVGTSILDAAAPVGAVAVGVADVVGRVTHKLPSLPLVDRFPTAAEVVGANFALAERLLAAQKDFAVKVLAPVASDSDSNA